MKIETVKDGIRYTLSNEGLKNGDKAYSIGNGRCVGNTDWILHGLDYEGFPEYPHIIINLEYSDYLPYEIKTNYGFGPKVTYYKIIKREIQVDENPDGKFSSWVWTEITEEDLAQLGNENDCVTKKEKTNGKAR